MAYFIDPVQLSIPVSGAWTDIDVSSHCPAGTTGLILYFSTSGTQSFGVRKKGGTDDFHERVYGSRHTIAFTGVDSSRVFQVYVTNTGTCELWLLGYFKSEAVFFTNRVNRTPSATGSWTDIDISGDTGQDTAIGAMFEVWVNSEATNKNYGFRVNGSTDNRYGGLYYHAFYLTGVDAGEICECYIGDSTHKVYLVGYITGGAVFHTNRVNVSPSSSGSWQDLQALPSGARGGIYEIYSAGGAYQGGVRKNGSTWEPYNNCNGVSCLIAECDASLLCEAKVQYTPADQYVYELGYFTEPSETFEYAGEVPVVLTPEAQVNITKAWEGQLPVSLSPEGITAKGTWGAWILKNSLQAAAEYVLKNAFPAGREYALKNAFPEPVRREIIIKNSIRQKAERSVVLKNALLGTAPARREVLIRNELLEGDAAIIRQPNWDVTLNGQSMKGALLGVTLRMDDSSFTNEAELALAGLEWLETLEAAKGTGDDSLQITIEGRTFRFLVEEVEVEQRVNAAAIQVWGRSKTALLADPLYSVPVTKVWEEPILASAVVGELASGFTIQFDIEDFLIPARALSAQRAMPLEIIRRVAGAMGGIVRSGPLGELIIRPKYPTAPVALPDAVPDLTLYESEDLLSLGDRKEPSQGWNAVTVKGRTTSADEPDITAELDSDRNGGRTTFRPGEEAYVRVFTRPLDLDYAHQVTLGTATLLGTYELEIEEEEIEVRDGAASTRYPILDVVSMSFDGRVLSNPEWEPGGQQIRFQVAEGCSGSAYLRLHYKSRYDLWKVRADEAGVVVLCLEDEED